nr:MAG TPA: proteolytically activated form of PPO4, type-3 copper protein, tyrosinase [Bacteriophage sp.]
MTLSIKKDIEKESKKLESNRLVYKNLIKVLCLLYSFLGIFWSFKKTCPDTLLILANKKDRAFCPIFFLHHSQIILTTKTIYVNFYSKSSLI